MFAPDPSALTGPIDEQQLATFIAESKASGRPWRLMTTGLPPPGIADVAGQLIPVVVPLAGVLFFVVVGGRSLIASVGRFAREGPFPLNLAPVAVLILVLLGVAFGAVRVVGLIRALRTPRSWWVSAYRITRFARANQLAYGHDDPVPHPGVIFGTGSDRVAERRLTATAGRRIEIGSYRYTIRGDKREDARVHRWGYLAIALDRPLPHLLLDAKANDASIFGIRTSNLPVDLAADQKLALGGEFDAAFTLYAPDNYGRDAFAIFTPDVMALFLDHLAGHDVEIVDDTLFVYGSPVDLYDPATYRWLDGVVETVVARLVSRTATYRDDFALLESPPADPDPGAMDRRRRAVRAALALRRHPRADVRIAATREIAPSGVRPGGD